MPRHYSTTNMVERLSGLLGTNDLTDWEQEFIGSCLRKLRANQIASLTEKQVETLDRLHSKHFA